MKLVENIEDLYHEKRIVWSIGMFDGFHIAHQKIISKLVNVASENNSISCVITFRNHPLSIIAPLSSPKLLSTIENKISLINSFNIDYLCVLEFTQDFSKISHTTFFEKLSQNFIFFGLVLGYNFKFGFNNLGTIDYLKEKQKELPYTLSIIDPLYFNCDVISSSRVRSLVSNGLVEDVSKLLGRNYFIDGQVIQGERTGREIGFPTINISNNEMIYPKDGVYLTETEFDGLFYKSISFVGKKSPSIKLINNSVEQHLIETYIFNFNGIIYNKKVKVHFLKWIREPKLFSSLEELKTQIYVDIEKCKNNTTP